MAALIQHVGFDAGLYEHIPGFLGEEGIGIRFKAEIPGRIIFFASDGRPTEEEVIEGFLRASDCFWNAIADTEINGLAPADIAGIKDHVHLGGAPTLPPKLLPPQKVSQFLEK